MYFRSNMPCRTWFPRTFPVVSPVSSSPFTRPISRCRRGGSGKHPFFFAFQKFRIPGDIVFMNGKWGSSLLEQKWCLCDKPLCWVWYSWRYTWGIHTSYSTSFRHRFGVGPAMCLQPAGINSWWCEICQCWSDISHKNPFARLIPTVKYGSYGYIQSLV